MEMEMEMEMEMGMEMAYSCIEANNVGLDVVTG